MCLDDDNAGHVTEYINAQLSALHQIAEKCHLHALQSFAATGSAVDHPSTLPGYDFALAGFYRQQASALSSNTFSATFGAPIVEFICNHDALIHLNIYEATLTTTSRKTSGSLIYGPYKSKTPTETLETAKESIDMSGVISIRVPYAKFDLAGHADVIGRAPRTLNTLILDLEHPLFVTSDETTVEVTEAFKPSILAYLAHFAKSGHHILHCLPPFEDEKYHRAMDFSAVTQHSYDHIQEMYNIHREKIVTYLKESWRTAAWSVQSSGGAISLGARKSIAIAEWNSTWSAGDSEEEYHFEVKFGAPTIQLLCEHEAIVYLQVDEIRFSETKEFKSTDEVHRNWQIALVVDIHHTVEESGSVQILSIDTRHGGKFAQALSTFIGFDLDVEINLLKFTRLVTFLSQEYFQILEEGGFYFYRWDSRISSHGRGGATDPFKGHTHGDDYGTDVITQADMRGFQQIIILSQASLDEVYGAYYDKPEYGWMKHREGKDFDVTYGVLKVRLLSNNRALVFVHIKAGKLRTLRDGKPWDKSESHPIGEWELAFEVGIKMVESLDLSDELYKGAPAWKLATKFQRTKLVQLLLDFETAEFKFGLSRFDDPAFGYTRLSLEKAAAAHYFVKKYYFGNMAKTAARIVHTITLSDDVTENRPRYAFAKAAFHIYSKTTVTYANYNIIPPGEEPVIVVVGMTDPNLPLPSDILRWSTNWLLGYGSTLGTLALSRDIFLHGRLLPLLEGVNRATTLLPASLDMDAGNWLVKLTTWKAKYAGALNRSANWEELPRSTPNAFQYKWDYTDEYEYNHEGRASDKATGTNFLSMKTDNRLTIPTTFRAGQLDITMHGTTSFAIGWTRADEEVRLSSSASWTIVISAVTSAEGLKISINKEFTRSISDETVSGAFDSSSKNHSLRPKTMLEESFPERVPLTDEISALQTFEGVWRCLYPGLGSYKLASPFFTERGDLLVELRSDSPTSTAAKPTIRPSIGKGRPGAVRPIISRPGSVYRPKNGSGTPSPVTPFSSSPLTPGGLQQPISKGVIMSDPFATGNGNGAAKGNGLKQPQIASSPLEKKSDPLSTGNGVGGLIGKSAVEEAK